MIKIEYWNGEYCIIDKSKMIFDTGGIKKAYQFIPKEVSPSEGDPDIVLGNRLIKELGEGELIILEPFKIEENVEY